MRRQALAPLAVLLVALVLAPVSQAHTSGPTPRLIPGAMVPLVAGQTSQRLWPIGMPREQPSSLTTTTAPAVVATADIQVNYTGFTSEAQAAFEAAANVWESMIASSQVIHVNASWAALGSSSGILGQAGPSNFYLDGDNRAYPAALAEAKCSCELSGNEISAQFNSQFTGWYLGTDGNPPSNKYDFMTVVLHELGHGLGFLSSFAVSGSLGYWGVSDGFNNYALWFDENEWSAASDGALVISFANGSSALNSQLTDGSVYFGGSNTVALLGARAKLYAPSPWQGGSSNSHLDEAAFPSGTTHALMTPALSNGEVIHDPGALTLAIFRDIGWTTLGAGAEPPDPSSDTTAPTVSPPLAVISAGQVLGTSAMLHVTWPEAADESGINAYELQLKKGSNSWVAVPLGSPTATSTDVALLPGSTYTLRLRATDGASNVGQWATSAPAQLSLLQENAASVAYGGTWRRASLSGASGGYVRYAGAAGRTTTLTFSGTSVGLLSTLAPARGIAQIWLDGSFVESIDLYASSATKRVVVWAPTTPLSAGPHTLQVRVTGTRNPSATKNRIDVDAFLIWP